MRIGRRHLVAALGACLLAALVPAAVDAAPAAAPTPPPGAQVGFWASQNFAPSAAGDPGYCPHDLSVYTPELWSVLAQTKGALYLDLVYTSDFGPLPAGIARRTDGLALIRHANRLGIPVNAWITTPLSGGTFANENNAALMDKAVRSLAGWIHRTGVRVGEVALDMEFPLGVQVITDALAGDLTGIEQLARANLDPSHQCRALGGYRRTVAWAHAHGLRITGTPVSFAVDDLVDGNLALQDLLDVAPGPSAPFDQVYVQAYRSYSQPSPAYVASYFRTMRQLFGARGQVTLGDTGTPPYDDVANLVADVRMLAGLGATTIPIFDLDQAVKTYGTGGVRAVIEAGRHPLTGAALRAMTVETPYDILNRQVFRNVDTVAADLTFALTTAQGRTQQPTPFPNTC